MILPNFLVIGAQRSGSTWLYQVLRRHPEVFMPEQKELEFFSYPARIEELGLAGYSKTHFGNVRNKKAVGEASPSYLWTSDAFTRWCRKPEGLNPDIPGTVKKHLGPDVKIVATLRNPVDRAVSGYLHHMRLGRIPRGKSIIEAGVSGGVVHIGFYYQHLQCWAEHFDRDNLFIQIFEDTLANPQGSFKRLFQFLGVDDAWTSEAITQQFNKGLETVEREGNLYVPKKGAESANPDDLAMKDLDLVVTSDDLAKLRQIYKHDIINLAKFLKRDLKLWLN